jgi:hypothetical protein
MVQLQGMGLAGRVLLQQLGWCIAAAEHAAVPWSCECVHVADAVVLLTHRALRAALFA